MIFQNREDAGRKLAIKLKKFKNKNVLVLALPRGGVPVAAQISGSLKVPLDVLVVRKIGVPRNPELALGALAPNGILYLDKLTIQILGITDEQIKGIAKKEEEEIIRRQKEYRGDQPPPDIKGKIIILVDDGIATGASVKTAIRAIQKKHPLKLIVAVPVCSIVVSKEIKLLVDEFICLETPRYFTAVSGWYKNFAQITDKEVKKLLRP